MIPCRNCSHSLYKDDYYGYCSEWCAIDYAAKHNLTADEAVFKYERDEMDSLEAKVDELECEVGNSDRENEELYDNVAKLETKIQDLRVDVKELKNLDWDKIKKEREEDDVYNDALYEKCQNMRNQKDKAIEERDKVIRDNVLLYDQNLDLLKIIKEMDNHSDRFSQLDLGIELDYD